MTDERFTKIAAASAIVARDLIEWGAEKGELDIEKFKWAIEPRRQEAKRLTAPVSEGGYGLSHEKAAKLLGVNKSTVQRDLGRKAPESGAKSPNRNAGHPLDGCDAPDDDDSQYVRWEYNFSSMARHSIELPSWWAKHFDRWETFEVTESDVEAAEKAAEAWTWIATKLRSMVKWES